MAVHDAYARVTPYELAFPSLEWARRTLAEIRDDAAAKGVTLDDPANVLALDATHRAIDTLRARDSDEGDLHSLALLLGHAVHFWGAGEKLVLLTAPKLRSIIETRLSGIAAVTRSTHSSGYVQLPHRMVWLSSEEGEAPESVDGFFWSIGADARLSALLVIGMRSNRDGFGVVPLRPMELSHALETELRESASAEAASLPGAELDSLVTLGTAADAVRLVLGSLLAIASDRSTDRDGAGAPSADDERPDRPTPAPSALPYRRVDAV
jgi:hypothetical protein